MTKAKKEKTVSAKKKNQQQVIKQLETTLPGLKEILGDKEFEKRIKKAAKLLTEGIKLKKKKSPKKAGTQKPAVAKPKEKTSAE